MKVIIIIIMGGHMINLFYKYRFKSEYKAHDYFEIEIDNSHNLDIENKLVNFIDTDSYRGFIGLIVNKKHKTLVKIVSDIFELSEEDYSKISNILLDGHMAINNEKLKVDFILTIRNVIDYLEICQSIKNNNFLYRGQADFEWKLEPSIFRKGIDTLKEKNLYKDILQWNAEIFSSGDFLKDTCNMQHYGIPTRLMDWTSNPLHALYFACVGASEDNKDGEILCVNIDRIYDIDSEECTEINNFLKHRFMGENNNEGVDKEKKLEKTLTQFACSKIKFMFFRTKYFNERIKTQQGYFSIYIDITDEEAQNIKRRILKDIIDNIIKYLRTKQVVIRKDDEERIKTKVLLDYNKYTNNIENNIYNTINEVLTVGSLADLNKYILNEVKSSKFEEIKYKQHRMEEILTYEKYLKIRIPKEVKKEIASTLDSLGVNSRVIYPDIEGLSRYMKEKYQ
jgi:hypothetical protein